MPDILQLRLGFKGGDISFPHVQQIGRADPRRLRQGQRMPGSDKGLADKLRAKPRFLVGAGPIAQLRFGQAAYALLAKVTRERVERSERFGDHIRDKLNNAAIVIPAVFDLPGKTSHRHRLVRRQIGHSEGKEFIAVRHRLL